MDVDERSEVISWAKTARVADPVRWGQLEREILNHPPATRVKERLGREDRWLVAKIAVVGLLSLLTAPIALALILAPAVVLVIVLVTTSQDGFVITDGWESLVGLFAVVASLGQVSFLVGWFQERRRDGFILVYCGLSALLLGSTYAVLRAMPESGDTNAKDWITLLTLVGTVAALATTVLTAVSKPEGRARKRRPPRRGPRRSGKALAYQRSRAAALQVLVDRGAVQVDEADVKRLNEMPLGYWEELDGVPEQERRRILELRLVGWRDFDHSDKRPFPPPGPARPSR